MPADQPILLLDEPTEGLDVGTVAQFHAVLDAAMTGRSVPLFTHRLGSLARLVDEVATMRRGRIVACAALAPCLASPQSHASPDPWATLR